MSFTISDFLKTRINIPSQPSPWLAFYEIELPDSTYLRYVDYFDQEETTPGEITFDGKQWTGVDIYRGSLDENLEGARAQLSLTVHDPLHTIAYFVRQYGGLIGQTVRLWITTQDHLATPADALEARFRVISVVVSQHPHAVTFVLGHFNLYEGRFPRIFYDRRRCYNLFQDRFVAGNWCTYPSMDFSGQNQHDYRLSGVNVESERINGWYSQQALRAKVFSSHYAVADKLKITSEDSLCSWMNSDRYGPYFYRYLSGDYDMNTVITPITGRDDWMAGVIAQDTTQASPDPELGEPPPEIPVSSWIFAGLRDDGASGEELVVIETDEDASTITAYSAVDDTRIRLTRAGNTFTVYTRADDVSSWTQRHQATGLTLPTNARIGLAIASPDEATDEFGATFDYIRFASGGLTTCRRDFADCQERKNTFQFNGFREIPDDVGRYTS